MADPLMAAPAGPPPGPAQLATGTPAEPIEGTPTGPMPDATPEEEAARDETFETLTAALLEHISKPEVSKGLVKQIKGSKNTARAAGQAVFALMQPTTQQAEQAGMEMDMEMLLDVAAFVLDSLMERLKAAKVAIDDEEAWGMEAIMAALEAYAATAPEGSEDKAQAQAALVQMQQDGTTQEGAAALQSIGAKQGVDPFAPKEKPMAQGVKAGLMGSAA